MLHFGTELVLNIFAALFHIVVKEMHLANWN